MQHYAPRLILQQTRSISRCHFGKVLMGVLVLLDCFAPMPLLLAFVLVLWFNAGSGSIISNYKLSNKLFALRWSEPASSKHSIGDNTRVRNLQHIPKKTGN
eukprot:610792-Amphidinium_carterae.1